MFKPASCDILSYNGVKCLFTDIDKKLSELGKTYLHKKRFDLDLELDYNYIDNLLRHKKMLYRLLYSGFSFKGSYAQNIISKIQTMLNY